AAAILGVIATASGIGNRAHAARLRPDDRFRQQAGAAHALVVIADEYDIGLSKFLRDRVRQFAFDAARNRLAGLAIDPDHLPRSAGLRTTDVSLFHRGRAVAVGDHAARIDAKIAEDLPNT